MKGSCREKKEINWRVNQKTDDTEDQDLGSVTGQWLAIQEVGLMRVYYSCHFQSECGQSLVSSPIT